MRVATDSRVCIHCGTRFRNGVGLRDFCCTGCQFVHDLIVQQGLGQFYDLQDGAVPPVSASVFEPRDYAWLMKGRASPREGETYHVQGISCIGCVWLLERLFQKQSGAGWIRIDANRGSLVVRVDETFDRVRFAQELQRHGYLLGPASRSEVRSSRNLIIRLGVCGALAMNAMLFSLPSYLGLAPGEAFARYFSTVALACGTLSFLIGGSYFIERAARSLGQRLFHIDLPIALGLIAAWSGSVYAWLHEIHEFLYFDFVSVFTFLMLVGRWLQQRSIEANRRRLIAATGEWPHPAAGERLRIASGGVVPVRSMLVSGDAHFSMEWINGESEAHIVRTGQAVAAGAINLAREEVEIEALERWEESLLSRLVDERRGEAPRNARLQKFLTLYLVVILIIGLIAFLGWLIMTGSVIQAVQVLISVWVVSCPCAAGVALPLADDIAAAALQKAGVFVRETSLWWRLRQVRRVVFDKTGTLTLAGMTLREPEAVNALGVQEQRVLLAMVRTNLHPVACALREALMAAGTVPAELDHAPEEVVGSGIVTVHEGVEWRLGRPLGGIANGEGDCTFTRDGVTLGAFRFTEELRPDAVTTLSEIRRRGCEVHILSGDRGEKVAAMAKQLGLDAGSWLGRLSPDEKAAWIACHEPERIMMIGDGANDSLAFNSALCCGTPAIDRGLLAEKADFYFLGRSLGGLRALFAVADARLRAVRAVVAFALLYNAVTVGLAIAGRMNPLAAAILMPLSSLVTVGIVWWCRPRGRG